MFAGATVPRVSGSQIFVLALLLGIGVLGLMFTALRTRTPAAAELGVGNAFSFKISISPADKDKAAEAAGQAAHARGQSANHAADEVRRRVAPLQQVELVRALWVDDNPDNNVYENIALAHLGVLVTSAASNAAARAYLPEIPFDLVITDVGRGLSRDDGRTLIQNLHKERPELPVIVYTINAAERRDGLLADGAFAVEDEPHVLISAVLAALKELVRREHR